MRTQKFTPKVRDSRQIQCYQKCVIRDKLNTKNVEKTLFMFKILKKPWNYIQSAKNLQFMNIYTQNCVIRDKVIFLHHHLSRSPSEFLHQLGLFYTNSVSTVSTFLHLCRAMSLVCSEAELLPKLKFHFLKSPCTARPPSAWPSDQSEVPKNGLKWFPIPQILWLDTKTNYLVQF